MPQTKVAYHPLQGGLDLVSPVLNVQPGFLLDGINYEPDLNGGYRRIPGYERFDGQPSPSARANTVLLIDKNDVFNVGDVVTGQSSQAQGTIVLIDKGSQQSPRLGSLLCLCSITGTFELETINSNNESAAVTSLDYTSDALTAYKIQAVWEAIETHYRSKIQQPPGTGAIEGVCSYQDTTYAFRANDDDLIIISRSTPSGWEALPQKKYMRFNKGGERVPKEGDTFQTQKGSVGEVLRYIRQGGSSDDLSVYGYLMVDTINGSVSHADRLELGEREAGKVDSIGYVAMTVQDVPINVPVTPVGKKMVNQDGVMATLKEEALRQPGNAANTVNLWMLVTDIEGGEFKSGDQIRRVLDWELEPEPEPDPDPPPDPEPEEEKEPIPEPFGTVQGEPLNAIRSKEHGDDSNLWPNTGDILSFNTGDVEARVFWRNYYGVSLPKYGEKWLETKMTIGTGNSKNDYVGYARGRTGKLEPKIIEWDDQPATRATQSKEFNWFCRKDNKYMILSFVGVTEKPAEWPDQITLLAEDQRLVLTWKDKDTTEKIEAGYQEDFGFNATFDPWKLVDRKDEEIAFTIYKDAVTFEEERRLYLILQEETGDIAADDTINVIEIAGYVNGEVQPITVKAGGIFEFDTWNFYARPDQTRIYGCNGQGPAFELDPNTGLLCPILMDDDEQKNNPHLVECHKNHLFLGLEGGLVRHSVIGEPMNFNGQLGAFEVGTGDDVTALVSHPGDVLAIICRNRIQGLYGQTIDDWQMNLISENAGGYRHSAQLMQQAYVLDDNGIIELQRVMAYGNFEQSAISRLVQPLINQYKRQITGSTVLRDENLISYFFQDGHGISFRPNPQGIPEILNFEYPVTVDCVHHAEDRTGSARVFFGTQDGWVYEARIGSNFDGEPIEAVIRTAYNHLESAPYRKAFKRLELMLSGGYQVYLQVGMELDYSAAYTPQPIIRSFTLFGGQGGYWNEDDWNDFYWSGQDVSTGEVTVSGTGKNYSLFIYSNSPWIPPYTLQGVMVHYIPRRLDRG